MSLHEVRIGRRALRAPRPRQRLFNYYYFMYKKKQKKRYIFRQGTLPLCPILSPCLGVWWWMMVSPPVICTLTYSYLFNLHKTLYLFAELWSVHWSGVYFCRLSHSWNLLSVVALLQSIIFQSIWDFIISGIQLIDNLQLLAAFV